MQNRLANTTSPYLIQHKDNPVHWQPWDNEALAVARAEDKPILLSIGYSACHWCHVMAHESFENPAIAALMNEHFINIKIDREERPDLDQIYMHALGLLGQQGGWPLTMFLTPHAEPFWGGTYFPPESRYGRPGFPEVLTAIARIWQDERPKVDGNKKALIDALGRLSKPEPGEMIAVPSIDKAAKQMIDVFDPVHGGFQGAPKFPQTPILDFLWRRALATDDQAIANSVINTLNRMCQGGIYDHLGGGFARYSVDDHWLVPHFEKMLYDNALLLGLLADVFARTKDPLFQVRAKETVGWLAREMLVDGGFASALDADSEGEEGKFYVWREREIDAALGEDAPLFKATFDVTADGNWEGQTILNRSSRRGLRTNHDETILEPLVKRLLDVREQRVRPGRDDKVLADWNGLMIAALSRASAIFGEASWLDLAKNAFAFVLDKMTRGDRIAHSWRDGRTLDLGFLDDYAAMTDAALSLYQHSQDPHYLNQAMAWIAYLDSHFRDDTNGGYFQTAKEATDILVRPKNANDGPYPAGNGLMVTVLARLFDLTGDDRYRQRADELVRVFAGAASKNPALHATLLNGFAMLDRPVQIVLTGDATPALAVLKETALAAAIPGATVQTVEANQILPEGHPASGKGMLDQKPTAYICIAQACRLPITDPTELKEQLNPKNIYS